MASKEVLDALETLHRELEKLEPAIKHVETAQQVTQIVKGIPQKHLELLKEVKDNDALHKDELKSLFAKELTALTDENKMIQKATQEIQQLVKAEQEALLKLKNTIQDFHDRIGKINFPERLDKLDANVAGIMAAIQSVQTRLDSIERNITDRIRDLSDYQKETRSGLQSALEQIKLSLLSTFEAAAKKQQILIFISWALIALLALLVVFLKKG